MKMGTEATFERSSPEYLAQLLKDKKQIAAFPNVFIHTERLIDEEINKVRMSLFHLNTNAQPLQLPDPDGTIVNLTEKLYVPAKDFPDFNFVGRILGPRGMTAKQLEKDTGCKIMVRGKGSMRDKFKEEQNRGKPNWEHLSEELHVLITVEDTKNRAEMKMLRAVEEVKKLLVPAPEGEDELKKMQLMELAILNGTFRDPKAAAAALVHFAEGPRMIAPPLGVPSLRSPAPVGSTQFILSPRIPSISTANLINGSAPPPLVSPADAGLLYPYDIHYGLSPAALLEYHGGMNMEASVAGAVPKMRRSVREHPYTRSSLT